MPRLSDCRRRNLWTSLLRRTTKLASAVKSRHRSTICSLSRCVGVVRRMLLIRSDQCGAHGDQQRSGRACGEMLNFYLFEISPHSFERGPFAPQSFNTCIALFITSSHANAQEKNLRKHSQQTLGNRRVARPCRKLHPLPRRSHSLGPHRGHLRSGKGPAVRAAPLRRGSGNSGRRRRGLCGHQARAVCRS